jgi:DNA invertase Pin-like site-specific DNA recombinase
MPNIGYIRVSTIKQNTDRQEIALSNLGIEKIFSEKISGKSTKNRPALKEMLNYLREDDVLYIESISRLARSTRDLLSIVDQLQKKKVGLVSLKEHIDTTTAQGRFVLTIFAALSELERESTLQRQKEGIAAARLKGKHLGRPKMKYPKEFEKVYKEWREGKITAVHAFNKLNMKKATFYKMVKQYENKGKEKGEK